MIETITPTTQDVEEIKDGMKSFIGNVLFDYWMGEHGKLIERHAQVDMNDGDTCEQILKDIQCAQMGAKNALRLLQINEA